jgi:hypothetical protein
VLQHCLPPSIRRTLEELPISLDETYERVLKEIGPANRDHAYRLLQCLTVAIRPLRVEELTEILMLDYDRVEGEIPEVIESWGREDWQQSVLSTRSSLITVVNDGESHVIQFSHFSVKEFLTSDRLAAFNEDTSDFHIDPEPAHTTLARACLGILLHLDGGSNNNRAVDSFPLVIYASHHWVEHAQFGLVSSRIEDGMRRLFDSTKPYFSAWLRLHDIDEPWSSFGVYKGRGSPLYYASLCGFRYLAAHIIAEHPEQVYTQGGRDPSALAAALHKRHFDVAKLLYQQGASVDVIGERDRTLLQAASEDGLIDVAQWLIDHDADADLRQHNHRTQSFSARATGHLQVVPTLPARGVRTNTANHADYTPLNMATQNLTEKADGMLVSRSHENPSNEPSERTPPVLIPVPYHYHSQSSTSPTRASLTSSPPPTGGRERPRLFGERQLSPVPDDLAKATQPITPMTRAVPQAIPEVSPPLFAVSLGGAAAPATSAPAQFPSSSNTTLLSRSTVTHPEHVGGHKSDGEGTLTPASIWWTSSKRKRTIPIKQADGYTHIRSVRQLLSACYTNTYAL